MLSVSVCHHPWSVNFDFLLWSNLIEWTNKKLTGIFTWVKFFNFLLIQHMVSDKIFFCLLKRQRFENLDMKTANINIMYGKDWNSNYGKFHGKLSDFLFFCFLWSALQPYISAAVTWNKLISESFNSNFNKYHGRLL